MKKCVEDYVELTIENRTIKISLYKLSNSPNYYYYFRHKGEKFQSSCKSSDLETSKQIMMERCFELTKGLREKGHKKKIKLNDIIKDFLKYKQQQGKKPKTLTEYTRQSDYILQWYNETSKGSDINVFFSQDKYKDYQDWRRDYYTNHKNIQTYERNGEDIEGRTYKIVGNTSLNRECVLLHQILLHGKKYKGILKDFHIPSYKKLKERSEIEEKVILDDLDEYNKVKEYWLNKDPFIWDCFSTITHLFLRPNELGKITFGCVHLKDGYIEIKNRKSKGRVINSNVPLDNTSRKTFQKLMKRSGIKKGKDDPVFVREGMEKPYTSPYLSKLFKKSVKLITGKDMTLHSLRHLGITLILRKPINTKLISKVVGWTDETMLSRYEHLMYKHMVEVFQKVEQDRIEEKQKKQEQEGQQQD